MKRATVEPLFSGFVVVISIHALVKRATSYLFNSFFAFIISIHALVKRATIVLIAVSLA